MPVNLVADENVDFRIVKALISKGFKIISILLDYRGFSDKQVLEVARQNNAVLLTEDKDFGEWVFAHKEKTCGIVFLRYKTEELEDVIRSLVKILTEYDTSLQRKFVTLTAKKIRMRELF